MEEKLNKKKKQINIFQEINKVKISYRFASRRDGDVGIVFANTNLSQKILGWTAKRSVSQMCQDGWKWSQKNPNGFKQEKNLSI